MEYKISVPGNDNSNEDKVISIPASVIPESTGDRKRPHGHQFLTVEIKKAICEFKESHPDAKTKDLQSFALARYGVKNIPRSTIHTILKDKEKYMDFDSTGMDPTTTTRIRKGRCEKMENVLFSWYKKAKATGSHVSDAQVVAVARYLGEKMDVPENFAFSSGWLSLWKERKGISKPGKKRPSRKPKPKSTKVSSTICKAENSSTTSQLVPGPSQTVEAVYANFLASSEVSSTTKTRAPALQQSVQAESFTNPHHVSGFTDFHLTCDNIKQEPGLESNESDPESNDGSFEDCDKDNVTHLQSLQEFIKPDPNPVSESQLPRKKARTQNSVVSVQSHTFKQPKSKF